MFGFKKKTDLSTPPSTQDIEDVKRRVLGESMDDTLENLIPSRPLPQVKSAAPTQQTVTQNVFAESSDGEIREETVPYAPVFVKLEKYGDLLTELAKTEAIVEHLKEAIALRDKIEQIHGHVINEIRESTALLENHLDNIDRKFRKPEAPKVDIVKPKQKVTQLDKIHEELENLKKELKELK